MTSPIEQRHARGRAQHGDKYDPSDIDAAPQFHPYFGTGTRIKVARHGDYVRTGTVSSTLGWKPALLLMHRSNDLGSSDVLGPDDEVIAVQRGRTYVPIVRQAT